MTKYDFGGFVLGCIKTEFCKYLLVVEEALRKDQDCPVEKETPKREREGASGREEAQPPPPGVETWSSSQC